MAEHNLDSLWKAFVICDAEELPRDMVRLVRTYSEVGFDRDGSMRFEASLRAMQGKMRNTQTLLTWMIETLECRRTGHILLDSIDKLHKGER